MDLLYFAQVQKARQLQVSCHLVPDGISHDFAIREHVEIESLVQTFAVSQSFPEQVHEIGRAHV